MPESLVPGATFAGCRLEDAAGRGGMGVVFRATQLALQRPVALKAIVPELALNSAYRERFHREAHLAASIEHPNVIPVYEAGDVDGTLYLIMRWVEGTDLRTLLKPSGPLSPSRAIRLLQPVAAALAAAHSRGLVHRDVKPANVLIARSGDEDEDDGHVYLTDFGIAFRTDTESNTRTGDFLGTIDYTAPERFEGSKGEPRSDIYSFGCMLFETLTGHVPFERPAAAPKVFAHVNAPIPSVSDEVDGVPEELDALIVNSMAKHPDDRFASAGELVTALAQALEQIETTGKANARPKARGDGAGAHAPAPLGAHAPTPLSGHGLPTAASSPELVGRQQELSILRAALEDARNGVPSIMLAIGEAGVGKSRLIRELEATARNSDMLVMRGQCLELSVDELPYAPIAAALRNTDRDVIATALAELPRDARRELARVFPDTVREDAALTMADDAYGQARLFGWILLLLRQLSERAPLLLSIEDLHYADMSSRDFLRFLVHNLRSERFVAIASVRSDDLHPEHPVRRLVAELARAELVRRLDLAALSSKSVERQVAGILGTVPSKALVQRLFARGQGNPFYTEVLVAAETSGSGDLPPTIKDVLLLRVNKLGERSRRILRLIAAAGRPVDDPFIELATRLPHEEIEAALRDCVDHNLVVWDRATGEYSVRHGLVSEAVYGDLLPPESAALHRRIAAAIAQRARPENAAERAHHWKLAHQPAEALLASIEAGLVAERVFGYGEALTQFERAIELWQSHPPAPGSSPIDFVNLLTRAAQAARSIGDSDRAYELGQRAVDELDERSDPIRAAQLYERLGRYQPWNAEASLAAYGHALDLLPQGSLADRMRLYVDQACAYSFLGQWLQARERAAQAIDIAQGDRTLAVESSAHAVLGVAIAFLGDPSAGEQQLRRALSLARKANSTEDLAQIHLDLGEVLRLEVRIEDALEMMLEGERVALAAGNHRAGNFLAVNAADDLLRLGRWDELEERLPELAGRHLDQPAHLLLDSLAGRLDVARGRFEQAATRFDAAANLCDTLGLVEFVPAVYSGRAELELWRQRTGPARAHISDGLAKLGTADNLLHIPLLHSMGARAAADAAQKARVEENLSEAEQAERAVLEHYDSLNAVVTDRGIEALPSEATGHLTICAAELKRAANRPTPELWAEAVSRWRGLSHPYKLAYLVYRYAESLLLTEDERPAAEATLQEAHALCVTLGATPLLAASRSLAKLHAVELWATPTPGSS